MSDPVQIARTEVREVPDGNIVALMNNWFGDFTTTCKFVATSAGLVALSYGGPVQTGLLYTYDEIEQSVVFNFDQNYIWMNLGMARPPGEVWTPPVP